MIAKILGIGDLLAVIVIIFSSLLPQKIIFYAAGYLLLKGGLFAMTGDFASYFDIACGLYILLIAIGFSFSIFTILVVLYLLQKGILSML